MVAARDPEDVAAGVLESLADRGETLATAESLTGGLLAVGLTDVPGASRSFVGGVVSYATRVKVSVLDVPADVVERARRGVGGVRDRDGAGRTPSPRRDLGRGHDRRRRPGQPGGPAGRDRVGRRGRTRRGTRRGCSRSTGERRAIREADVRGRAVPPAGPPAGRTGPRVALGQTTFPSQLPEQGPRAW